MAEVNKKIAESLKTKRVNMALITIALALITYTTMHHPSFAAGAPGYDAKIYESNPSKRLNVEISDSGVNRIEIKKDRITKVVGNEGEYSIEGDNKTGVIFLSSKGIAGQIFPITIITEKGYTQDINLKVKKISSPKSIIITKPVTKERQETLQNSKDLKSQVIEAIKDVTSGEDRNYTKRIITLKEIKDYVRINSIEPLGVLHTKGSTPVNNARPTIYSGYLGLEHRGVKITRVTEYTNREMKIYKYEYESKPSDVTLTQISKIFKDALATTEEAISTSERGNTIIVVYKNKI